MNALTTSLEELGKPIEIDSVIRISNLNMIRGEPSQLLKKNKDSWGHHQKRRIYALIARRKVILVNTAGLKAV